MAEEEKESEAKVSDAVNSDVTLLGSIFKWVSEGQPKWFATVNLIRDASVTVFLATLLTGDFFPRLSRECRLANIL